MTSLPTSVHILDLSVSQTLAEGVVVTIDGDTLLSPEIRRTRRLSEHISHMSRLLQVLLPEAGRGTRARSEHVRAFDEAGGIKELFLLYPLTMPTADHFAQLQRVGKAVAALDVEGKQQDTSSADKLRISFPPLAATQLGLTFKRIGESNPSMLFPYILKDIQAQLEQLHIVREDAAKAHSALNSKHLNCHGRVGDGSVSVVYGHRSKHPNKYEWKGVALDLLHHPFPPRQPNDPWLQQMVKYTTAVALLEWRIRLLLHVLRQIPLQEHTFHGRDNNLEWMELFTKYKGDILLEQLGALDRTIVWEVACVEVERRTRCSERRSSLTTALAVAKAEAEATKATDDAGEVLMSTDVGEAGKGASSAPAATAGTAVVPKLSAETVLAQKEDAVDKLVEATLKLIATGQSGQFSDVISNTVNASMKRDEYTHGLVDTGSIIMLRLCDGVRSLMRMFGSMVLTGRGGNMTFIPNHDTLTGKVVNFFKIHATAHYERRALTGGPMDDLVVESLYLKSVFENLFEVLFTGENRAPEKLCNTAVLHEMHKNGALASLFDKIASVATHSFALFREESEGGVSSSIARDVALEILQMMFLFLNRVADIKSIIWSPYSQALAKSTAEKTPATPFDPDAFSLAIRTSVVKVFVGVLKLENVRFAPLEVKWQLFPAAVQLIYQEHHYRMELGGTNTEEQGRAFSRNTISLIPMVCSLRVHLRVVVPFLLLCRACIHMPAGCGLFSPDSCTYHICYSLLSFALTCIVPQFHPSCCSLLCCRSFQSTLPSCCFPVQLLQLLLEGRSQLLECFLVAHLLGWARTEGGGHAGGKEHVHVGSCIKVLAAGLPGEVPRRQAHGSPAPRGVQYFNRTP
jgi:hypothetical protein